MLDLIKFFIGFLIDQTVALEEQSIKVMKYIVINYPEKKGKIFSNKPI